MVELLQDFPPYVAAYKASGTVDEDEYRRVIMNRVDEVARNFDALNFIVRLETGMENYSVAALIRYLEISFKHIHRWNRMAIVSDQKTVRMFYDALSPLVPGKIIGYELKDFEKAKAWVSEPCLTEQNSLQWDWKPPVVAGAAATTAMTLFSYAASAVSKRNFKEPKLLGELIQGLKPSLKPSAAQVLGWQTHYAVGTVWSAIYAACRFEKRPLASALALGAVSGLSAIFVWKTALDLNPRPPRVDRKKYYLQLVAAHFVFSFTLEAAYALRRRRHLLRRHLPLLRS